jgi:hypothetical protein
MGSQCTVSQVHPGGPRKLGSWWSVLTREIQVLRDEKPGLPLHRPLILAVPTLVLALLSPQPGLLFSALDGQLLGTEHSSQLIRGTHLFLSPLLGNSMAAVWNVSAWSQLCPLAQGRVDTQWIVGTIGREMTTGMTNSPLGGWVIKEKGFSA